MDFGKKRWICYGASLILVLCAGFQYSLSVFQIPLDEKFGWGIPKIAFAYSVLCIAELVTMVFFVGKIREKLGIRKFLILGGFFFGGGTLLCAFMTGSLWQLYLYQGVMLGVGHVILYPCLTAYVIQLVPERAGLVSGIVIAVYACGSLVWAPLSAVVTSSTGDVSRAFLLIGAIILLLITGLSLLLKEPPEGYRGQAAQPEAQERLIEAAARDLSRSEMIRTPLFYLFYLTVFIPILCGMMVLTQGATIFEHSLAVPATVAASLLGLLSICNACGRVVCGGLFDRFNPFTMMSALFGLYVLAFAVMILAGNLLFIIAACLCLLSFGGFAALVAPMTSRLFGVRYLTENFGLIFTSYCIAGVVAPVLVTNLRQWSGGYSLCFSIAIGLTIIGFFTSRLLKRAVLRYAQETDDVALPAK